MTDIPLAAYCEDADSDESSLPKAQGRKYSSSTVGRGKAPARDVASDSGYSSHASGPHLTSNDFVAPPVIVHASPAESPARPSGRPSSSSSKPPMIHRSSSTRSSQRSQTVSTPGQEPRRCSDANCRHPDCERRFTLPHRSPRPPQAYQPSPPQQQAPPPQPAYIPGPMGPPPLPTPRPRAGSSTRPTRPASMHGYSMPSLYTSFDGSQRGPPPSNSAYHGFPSSPYTPIQTMMGSTPPTSAHTYLPPSPGPMTSTFPTTGGGMYSARTPNPNIPGLDYNSINLGSNRTAPPVKALASARRSTIDALEDSQSESDQFSESDYSEDDRYEPRRSGTVLNDHLQLARKASRRSRPRMSKSYTTSDFSRRSLSRERKRIEYVDRPPRSDTGVDYLYPDQAEIDRTPRPTRRGTVSSSHSRRPSVSTTASSGRTPATTNSSISDWGKVTIEDSRGRRDIYMRKSEIERRLREQSPEDHRHRDSGLGEQLRAQEDAAAYQEAIDGERFELTAENMQQQRPRPRSGQQSHVGSQRSHKSSTSRTSKTSKVTDGFQIRNGNTVLHIMGGEAQLIEGEDGGPAQLVINGSASAVKAYPPGSSRSSGSRKPRSHVSRRSQEYDEEEYRSQRYGQGRRQ